MARLEAPLGTNQTFDVPSAEGLGEALEALRSEVPKLKQAPDQAPRRRADHDLPRGCERLRPRREVWGISAHCVLFGSALADQIADHDLTGRDAYASLQPHLGAGFEPSDVTDQLKPGTNCSFGIVLVGPRPAEIGEDAVPQEPGYVALEPANHVGAGSLIRPRDLAQVLRVKQCGQLGRAHEIAEQHGQLA